MEITTYYFRVYPERANSRTLRITPAKELAEVEVTLRCNCFNCKQRERHAASRGYTLSGVWARIPYIEPSSPRNEQLPKDLFIDGWEELEPQYIGKMVRHEGAIDILRTIKKIFGKKVDGWFPAGR